MDTDISNPRDRHLFGPGPKRILSLGGSGNSGAGLPIFIAFLERIEKVLSENTKSSVRLGDQFDLVGGASTGAITAAAVALGNSMSETKDLLFKFLPLAFKRPSFRMPVMQAKYDAGDLRRQIQILVGDRELSSAELSTGFCIIMKRMDTGSPWIASNNPRAPYWENSRDSIGNKNYPLVNLLCASTAAPHFFDPELLPVSKDKAVLSHDDAQPLDVPWVARFMQASLRKFGLLRQPKISADDFGLFVDGTLSPHGNPSLALLQLATFRAYGINWPPGPELLTVCSIGGGRQPFKPPSTNPISRTTTLAISALTSLMTDAEESIISQMQYLGECPNPWPVSDTGISADDEPLGGKICRFLHYDIELEERWIKDNLGETLSSQDLGRFQQLDDPAVMNDLYRLAQMAAERQVKPEHFS
jgi:hypothetical protein